MTCAGGSPNKALEPKEEEAGGAEPASPIKLDPQQPLGQLPKPAAVSSEESYDWLLCEETLSDSEVDEPAPTKLKTMGKAKAVSPAQPLLHLPHQSAMGVDQASACKQGPGGEPCCPSLSRLHMAVSMLLVSWRASLESSHALQAYAVVRPAQRVLMACSVHAAPCCSLLTHDGQWALLMPPLLGTTVHLPLASGSSACIGR